MECAWRGNLGVLSEFNFGTDPEAAKIVFNSGLPIRVAPMEVGRQAKILPDTSEKIKHIGKVGRHVLRTILKVSRGKLQNWSQYV
ncbi:nucleoside hydrolase [Lacticaseibacillus paracasei subsp. paracasei]|nr:nucleoside hydrolase [Lacticaseibacillus paracasei]MDH7443955.1 nucleoside hydrolase [Lacticaseibacillus paracasei subsp. paracasei]